MKQWNSPPEMILDPGKNYRAIFQTEKGDIEVAGEQLKLVTQKLDKTAATSTMHKKTAARKKSRLTKRLNALKAKKG